MSSKGKLITLVITLLLLGSIFVVFQTRGASTIKGLDLQNGLVGYWSFEEGSGLVAGDMSGNGNDGTLNNMDDSDWVSGARGGGLEFDGVDDGVEVDNSSILNDTRDEITLAVWLQPASSTEGSVVARNYGDTGTAWRIFASTDTLGAEIRTGSLHSATTSLTGTTTVHAVATYDNEMLRLYLDGVLVASNTAPSGDFDLVSNRDICIGWQNNNTDNCDYTPQDLRTPIL